MQPDQHVAGRAEVLNFGLVARVIERAPDAIDVGRILVRHFDHRAASELDRIVEPAVHEEEHRGNERDQRYYVEDQRIAHEGDGPPDLEEFHLRYFHAVLPMARRATRRRWP